MEKRKVYWIEGDGIGPDIWKAARPVLDEAVKKAYGNTKAVEWVEVLAGEKALAATGQLLPEESLQALRQAEIAIKGPLGTPIGKGFRSLNVTLRQVFDLYACLRPIRYYPGIASPVKEPEKVNMVVFRENTEDVYMGIEYAAQSPEAKKLQDFLRDEMGLNLPPHMGQAAFGLKPMSEFGSKRLVRNAIKYALDLGLPSVTLVHKGNIMKYTEGAFRAWGYEVAQEEFADNICLEDSLQQGKLVIKDRIADAMFQEALLRPEKYSVLATPNLNGDYISDALAAQVGGLGMAPGVNLSEKMAFFEATHGTAPALAGKDTANPCSLLLSGAMMLEHMGWTEAANRVSFAVEHSIQQKRVTQDLASQMENATALSCSHFAEELMNNFDI